MSRILIIIPAYNESKNIVNVITELNCCCPKYDYVIVNDGSKDDTALICRENHFPLIDLPENRGLAGAIRAGMRYADEKHYDYALQFDGDGQHQAAYIPKLVRRAEEDGKIDIVIGSRFVGRHRSLSLRMIGSRILSVCIWLTAGQLIHDPTSGMRLYRKNIIHRLAAGKYEPEPDMLAYMIRCGCGVAEVPVQMKERAEGESYLNLRKGAEYMIRMCLSIFRLCRFGGEMK